MRKSIIGLVIAVIALVAPGIAHAEPPANDDFDTATTVTALPFSTTQDTTQSTKAADDPTSCYYWGSRTVWFRYTAPADGIVMASVKSTESTPFIAVYTGDRGALTQVPGACTGWNSGPLDKFHVTAGTTYHIMLIELYGGGQVTLNLDPLAPSPNDDRAAATATGLPAKQTGDLRQASAEPDEVVPSCDAASDQSVWYRYTPDRTRSVNLYAMYGHSPTITVYQGNTEVDCVMSGHSVFTATAGQTYHIRVADDAEQAAWFEVRIEQAPAIKPSVQFHPSAPSVHDEITFWPYAGDSLGKQLVSGEIRFGDGASAPITDNPIKHRYAADGEYQVEVTGSTKDGRTGTGVVTLKVKTHDVTVTDFAVPATARVGQTKSIKTWVSNTRYDETVKVTLYRLNEHGQYDSVGNLTQWVAAGPNNKVEFPFAYTYTEADATAGGKVTFKVVATLEPWHMVDSNPKDNERLGATGVRPKTSGAH